jgi:16S rRNA (guanine966-N2)-methyltransferase
MMRIIAGTKRGMRLFSPKGLDSRPITDRVKESLFNVLCKYGLPEGAMAADLFCGVGSLGLETLSRGAEFVTFAESQPEIIAVLKRNIEKAGFVRTSKVIRADVFKTGAPPAAAARISNPSLRSRTSLESFAALEDKSRISNVQKYELVFVDPPYAFTEDVGMGSPLSGLLDLLQEQTAHDGLVVVRTSHRTTLLERYGRFEVIERRQWGTMAVAILKLADK